MGEYTKELLDAFEDCARLGLIGEELWKQTRESWSVYGIQYMSEAAILRLRMILLKGSVLVEKYGRFE